MSGMEYEEVVNLNLYMKKVQSLTEERDRYKKAFWRGFEIAASNVSRDIQKCWNEYNLKDNTK